MALREFRDSNGIDWKVWDTVPERMHASPASDRGLGELRAGWITFSSMLGRRRLAPVPTGWATMPAAELERLCDLATPTRRQPGEADTPAGEMQALDSRLPPGRAKE